MQSTKTIDAIMTRKPATVSPKENMEAVRAIFEEKGFHHIPVTEKDKLVGLVSYTDYLRVIRDLFDNPQNYRENEKVLHAMLVEDVMTKDVLCLQPDDSVEDALRIFKTNHFHSLPVIDEQNHLIGIVTTYDVLRVLEGIFASEQIRTM